MSHAARRTRWTLAGLHAARRAVASLLDELGEDYAFDIAPQKLGAGWNVWVRSRRAAEGGASHLAIDAGVLTRAQADSITRARTLRAWCDQLDAVFDVTGQSQLRHERRGTRVGRL